MIYNETINSARIALRQAAKEVKDFDGTIDDETLVLLFKLLLYYEGVVENIKDSPDLYNLIRNWINNPG